MGNFPIITFLRRTWMLLAAVLAANWLTLSKHAWYWVQLPGLPDGTPGEWHGVTAFEHLGAVLYMPAISLLVWWISLLCVHLFFRQTIELDVNSGKYLKDWEACTPFQRVQMHNLVKIGILIALSILCSSLARGAEPDQEARWRSAAINPKFSIALDINVALFKRHAARYQKIAAMRANGVPASVIFCLHQRESSGSFLCHPHEGSPLTGRTRFVPKGRIPWTPPPYTFEQSAEDAYYVVDHLDQVDWKNVRKALQGIESFNGLGYQKYHPDVPSPYLWNGLLLNGRATRGKYTGDGRFDRGAVDRQLGCAAILIRMREQGIASPWGS